MISIDTVYQKVLALANKEQRGYITPQDFNLFADQAQKEIFEQYFYDLNQLVRKNSNSEEYSDIVHNLNEKIAVFESIGTVNNGILIDQNGSTSESQDDIYRLGTVVYGMGKNDGVEVEEVQQNEILYINKSPLTAPTLSRPVYVRTGERTVDIYPATINPASFTYIRKPTKPSWGYFVVGTKALYDGSINKTTNFELHPSEEPELVYKILKYAGLSIKREDLTRGGQGLESMQVQQEKQ